MRNDRGAASWIRVWLIASLHKEAVSKECVE